MTANVMRWVLACELAFYALVSYALLRFFAAPAGCVGATVLLLALSGRALVIAITFLFARRYAAAAPPDRRIGWGRALRMLLEEYLSFVVLFSLLIPFFARRVSAQAIARQSASLPVLLIHGYQCNRAAWWWLQARLARTGLQVATLDLEPMFADIDSYVPQVAQNIEALCAATGAARIALVGHSMGGLVARAYLRRHGVGRVAKLITLGSPHHGSELAHLAMGLNGAQMRPGSAWLAALNAPGAVPLPDDSVAIYSCHDNYVMPQDSARLEGASNVPLAGIGHLAMVFSGEIERLLIAELKKA